MMDAALRAAAWLGVALALSLPIGAALAAGDPIPSLVPIHRGIPATPMRILRVTSSDPACGANCPEWISVEGVITQGTAAAFAQLVDDLRGRRLPVLISSPGGSVRDAIEMGQLIRKKRLAVAVARTLFMNCPDRAPKCPDPRGRATVDGAICASACPLVLAAGVERLIGPAPRIGVHQITTVLKEEEGVEHLTRTVKLYEQSAVDQTVDAYLTSAGVRDPVMTLLRKTPAASIRWLSLDEIKASRLATGTLDPLAPVRIDGANGLDALAFEDPPRPEFMSAKVPDRDGLGALTLIYRRGGGALGLALSQFDAGAAPSGWTVTAAGAPLPLAKSGDGAIRAFLPRDRFCAPGGDRRIVATAAAAPTPTPLVFNLAGVGEILDLAREACP